MHPQLFAISSAQIEKNELPKDINNFKIEIEIREPSGDDIETFYCYVVSPSYLISTEPCWGRGLLILAEFNWFDIEISIKKMLSHCSGNSWEEIKLKIKHFINNA
ncbi:Imm8 family immunity protein [Kangiella sp. TOML190]|uniref:Imm8 family immunity protein n=1 Tax=Kangiella sp. TOML190 TaxID=2931351 RepID=UPI00203C6252|nr:Imm8 family immunity protein [Kangiella sp. TOML190]